MADATRPPSPPVPPFGATPEGIEARTLALGIAAAGDVSRYSRWETFREWWRRVAPKGAP